MKLKNLSLHPKMAGFVDLFTSLLFLIFLFKVNIWWWILIFFVLRLAWFGVLNKVTYYPEYISKIWHFLSLAIFHFGMTLLMLFAEWKAAIALAMILYLSLPFTSFLLLPSKSDNQLSFVLKPYRRSRFFMCLFGLFGVWNGIFATIFLQIFNISFWALLLPGAVLTVGLAFWWWKEYSITTNKKLYLWTAGLLVLITELSIILFSWPLGYFPAAFVMIWFWYVLWTTGRFQLLPQSINWKKHLPFFIGNAICLALYLLLIVKWK